MNGRRQGMISLEWEKHGKKTLFPLNPSLYSGFLNGGDEEWFLLISHHLEVTDVFQFSSLWFSTLALNQDETPLLYSLVFGEEVVNDATSVVLFNMIQKWVK
ncbi:hypothetical protein ZIOFF_028031 [Zingiber officinale]|uniref:Uncharacterized protein n=1 Tax=Zingiber officinale TaxID=94328 RepID=A0A8J5GRF0_ZINOF|nr:hypothetical protein ZIOFF_028031 [Zingiber officinale]